jgi:DNA invertase Pin-like site-specific DNA recombinase
VSRRRARTLYAASGVRRPNWLVARTALNMKLGYARVSTTGQNLEAQIAALWAAGVEKIYQDKASGKDRNHPALKEMLDFARQGDEIVVARLDRFTRSSADLHAILAELKTRSVTVRFLDNPAMNVDTAHGELLLAILAATAAFERRLILTPSAEGRENAKAKGVKFGRPAVVSKELKAQIEALRAKGSLTTRQIGERLGVSRRTVYRALAS